MNFAVNRCYYAAFYAQRYLVKPGHMGDLSTTNSSEIAQQGDYIESVSFEPETVHPGKK